MVEMVRGMYYGGKLTSSPGPFPGQLLNVARWTCSIENWEWARGLDKVSGELLDFNTESDVLSLTYLVQWYTHC